MRLAQSLLSGWGWWFGNVWHRRLQIVKNDTHVFRPHVLQPHREEDTENTSCRRHLAAPSQTHGSEEQKHSEQVWTNLSSMTTAGTARCWGKRCDGDGIWQLSPPSKRRINLSVSVARHSCGTIQLQPSSNPRTKADTRIARPAPMSPRDFCPCQSDPCPSLPQPTTDMAWSCALLECLIILCSQLSKRSPAMPHAMGRRL